jgi:hypothetical protein
MVEDISQILSNWKFSDQDINVRYIKGMDGRTKLQMRLDLGILQMELDGRPDGQMPYNAESYFDYCESQAKKSIKRAGAQMYVLSAVDSYKLQQEAVQYYHRYLALMKLRDYARVVRDTSRNLRLFNFVERNADNDEIIWQFIQHRPYVLMMNTRARALVELDHENFEMALEIINGGIQTIQNFNEKWNDRIGPDYPELEFLQYWCREISDQKPMTEKERLNHELQQAVNVEDYERAARLRDKLAALERLLKF